MTGMTHGPDASGERDADAGAGEGASDTTRPAGDRDGDDDLPISQEEAAETLRAIRAGRVDAVVIRRTTTEEVLTFRDPDHAYRALVEAMAEGAALVTHDGIICYHNPRFTELTAGASTTQLRGLPLQRLVPEDAAASIEAMLGHARHAPARIEVELARSGETSIPVQLAASSTMIADHPVLCVVVTDLGEQRRQQELYRQALVGMEQRERMLSVAGHELRGPLHALNLQVEMLDRDCQRLHGSPQTSSGALRRGVERIRIQAKHLSRLVDSLLDLGRLESDQLELELDNVDLAEIVAAARDSNEELAQSGSEVSFVAEHVEGRWDRVRIAQVASNLISNAAKYGLGKPIHIEVAAGHGVGRLTVTDHGIGVEPDAIGRLFRPFERIGSVKAATGLGLGLYITAQIVNAHRGTIRVDSTPGVGSSFIVELPCQPN